MPAETGCHLLRFRDTTCTFIFAHLPCLLFRFYLAPAEPHTLLHQRQTTACSGVHRRNASGVAQTYWLTGAVAAAAARSAKRRPVAPSRGRCSRFRSPSLQNFFSGRAEELPSLFLFFQPYFIPQLLRRLLLTRWRRAFEDFLLAHKHTPPHTSRFSRVMLGLACFAWQNVASLSNLGRGKDLFCNLSFARYARYLETTVHIRAHTYTPLPEQIYFLLTAAASFFWYRNTFRAFPPASTLTHTRREKHRPAVAAAAAAEVR